MQILRRTAWAVGNSGLWVFFPLRAPANGQRLQIDGCRVTANCQPSAVPTPVPHVACPPAPPPPPPPRATPPPPPTHTPQVAYDRRLQIADMGRTLESMFVADKNRGEVTFQTSQGEGMKTGWQDGWWGHGQREKNEHALKKQMAQWSKEEERDQLGDTYIALMTAQLEQAKAEEQRLQMMGVLDMIPALLADKGTPPPSTLCRKMSRSTAVWAHTHRRLAQNGHRSQPRDAMSRDHRGAGTGAAYRAGPVLSEYCRRTGDDNNPTTRGTAHDGFLDVLLRDGSIAFAGR